MSKEYTCVKCKNIIDEQEKGIYCDSAGRYHIYGLFPGNPMCATCSHENAQAQWAAVLKLKMPRIQPRG